MITSSFCNPTFFVAEKNETFLSKSVSSKNDVTEFRTTFDTLCQSSRCLVISLTHCRHKIFYPSLYIYGITSFIKFASSQYGRRPDGREHHLCCKLLQEKGPGNDSINLIKKSLLSLQSLSVLSSSEVSS